MKIISMGAEFFNADRRTHARTHARTDVQMDRRTDMTKLIVALRRCTNAPESLRLTPLWLKPVQGLYIKLKRRCTKISPPHLFCIVAKRDLLFYVTSIWYNCWWKTSGYSVKKCIEKHV